MCRECPDERSGAGGGAGTGATDGLTLTGSGTKHAVAEYVEQAIERGDTRLTVAFGTKGGRPCGTVILDSDAVNKALDNALSIAESRNNRLIDKQALKSAMDYWYNQAARIGLSGAYPRIRCVMCGRRMPFVTIWRWGSAGKRRWQWWRWIWDMVTGVGDMWLRFMDKGDEICSILLLI